MKTSDLQVLISVQFQTLLKIYKIVLKLLNSFIYSINTEFLGCIECIFCYKIFFDSSVGEHTVTVWLLFPVNIRTAYIQ